jgi:hypothetical protein
MKRDKKMLDVGFWMLVETGAARLPGQHPTSNIQNPL